VSLIRGIEHDLPALDHGSRLAVVNHGWREKFSAIGVAFDRSEIPGRVVLHIHPGPQLPEDYRDGGEVVIGDTKDLRDGDVLHTAHPLVRAAIDEARGASGRPFKVRFAGGDRPLPESLAGLRGRRGHLVVTKIAYRGIESVDQLVTTALLEESIDPLDPQTVEALLSLVASDHDAPGAYAPPAALEEAVADAVLENQAATAISDRDRFDRMLWQLDRYVEDQALLLRRKQVAIEERIDDAERKRERALTAGGRAKEEEAILNFRRQIQHLGDRIATLENGDDLDYQLWRNRLHERRFRKPEVHRILEVEFEISGAASQPC
jgi:hypothetical protein